MVYFIGNEDFIKIGVSDEIHNRISDIQTSFPFKIRVHLLIEGGFGLENELHRKFSTYSTYGEWFRLSPEIVNYISSMEPFDLRWKYGLKPNEFVYPFNWIRKKFTLQEFADAVGTTPSSVRNFFEREKRGGITIAAAKKMAEAVGYVFEYRLLPKVKD